jgi:hypothetical protein
MHKLLKVELQQVRMLFLEGKTDLAQHHIRVALRLYEAARIGTFPPQVGNAIMWAVNSKAEAIVAIMALDQAMKLLDEAELPC